MKNGKINTGEMAVRIIGLVLCGLIICVGFLFVTGSKSHTGANGEGVGRASTSIEFGADFYTSSAQYTGLAANGVVDTYSMVRLGLGCLFIFIGGISCCFILLPWVKGSGQDVSHVANNQTRMEIKDVEKQAPKEEPKESVEWTMTPPVKPESNVIDDLPRL